MESITFLFLSGFLLHTSAASHSCARFDQIGWEARGAFQRSGHTHGDTQVYHRTNQTQLPETAKSKCLKYEGVEQNVRDQLTQPCRSDRNMRQIFVTGAAETWK